MSPRNEEDIPEVEDVDQVEADEVKHSEFRVRSFVNADLIEENAEKLSYIKLKRHIE